MKNFILLFSLLISAITTAQVDRYQTRTGEIKFEASVPTFEPIEAVNQSVTIVLDKTNGNLASLALIKGFKFPIALMQEHFNENYIESDQYPKAVLRGSLLGFEFSELSDHLDHTYTFKGTLEMHGIKKGISFPVSIVENNNVVNINANFTINPATYDIEIPSVVANKIADEVEVSVSGKLVAK